MLRSRIALVGLSAACMLSALAACSSETDTNGAGGDATNGNQDGVGKIPPAAPPATAPDGTEDAVFAVNKLYLGDTDRNGVADKNAWKDYGFNLDGKISTKEATDLCQPVEGASKTTVYPDGTEGIDNAFGKSIAKLLSDLDFGTAKVNEQLAGGTFTLLLKTDKLGAGKDYNPLVSSLYGGQKLGHAPLNDGTDVWPLIPELLTPNGDSKIQFPSAYLNGNTFVSGAPTTITIAIDIGGVALSLVINKAVITAKLSDDHKTATDGTIAGVLKTSDLLDAISKIPEAADLMDTVGPILSQASDILSDGTQDPSKPCDAISVGLGFDLVRAQLGEAYVEGAGGGGAGGAGGAGGGNAGGAGGAGGN